MQENTHVTNACSGARTQIDEDTNPRTEKCMSTHIHRLEALNHKPFKFHTYAGGGGAGATA